MTLWTIHNVDLSKFEYIELALIGDTHIGQEAYCERTLKQYLDWVLDDNCRFIVLMGDMLEMALSHRAPGSALSEQILLPKQQIRRFYKLFQPVADRILFMIGGNHEERNAIVAQRDTMEELAMGLRVQHHDPYEGWLEIKVGIHKYLWYFHHGTGVSKYPHYGLQKVIYESTAGQIADAVAMGHIHQLHDQDFPIMRRRGRRIVIDEVLGIRTGHCLNYAGYAKQKMLRPSPMGFPIVRMEGHKYSSKQMIVARGLDKISWTNPWFGRHPPMQEDVEE